MDGRALTDLADVRALLGAGGCELRDWPADLSATCVEGKAEHS